VAEYLRVALEEHAWDSASYRRAFYDDGTPIDRSRATNVEYLGVGQPVQALPLDVRLLDRDGFAVCRHLHAPGHSDLPIILMS
jgi:DNA-binding response OmpR family regulator